MPGVHNLPPPQLPAPRVCLTASNVSDSMEPTEKGSKVMLSKSFETFLLPISNMHAGGGGISYSTKQFSDHRVVSCSAP